MATDFQTFHYYYDKIVHMYVSKNKRSIYPIRVSTTFVHIAIFTVQAHSRLSNFHFRTN